MAKKLILEDSEARLLKGVLHAVYKTVKFKDGSGTSTVGGITPQGLDTIIALHDRLTKEIVGM